jgi:phytoene dehydrogenase-like protein
VAEPSGSSGRGWDAIVVGSGLGGLACAAYLCAAGRRTLVLESHYVAGGNSQVFRRRVRGTEYEFDVGIHYIGECGRDGLIARILDGLGLAERIVFRPLDPDGYSTLVFPDLRFRVPVGWDRYRARLLETFPEEAAALARVVDAMRVIGEQGRRLQNQEIGVGELFATVPEIGQWGLRPVTELFAAHGISQRAQAVLLGEQGDYAVRPSRTPALLAAGLTDHYMRGAFYPEGGGQVMAARLVEAIRAHGGEVRTRAAVERIAVEGGRARGVVLARSGERVDAPVVVSNADLKRTVLELVGAEHFRPETVERVRGFRMALPLFAAYLDLDVDLAALGVPNTNYWIWGSYDLESIYADLESGRMTSSPLAYVTAASLKDPTNPHLAPRGHTNLQIMTLVPREYAPWHVERGPVDAGSNRYHTDREYRRRKDELVERLIGIADGVIPGLAKHVVWKESATPVTQERFTRSTGGTSYGIEFATDQMGPMRVGPATDVAGLYLAGASTPSGHGIGGVLRSGVIAASAILEADLLGMLRAGERIGDPGRLPPLRADWDPWRASR